MAAVRTTGAEAAAEEAEGMTSNMAVMGVHSGAKGTHPTLTTPQDIQRHQHCYQAQKNGGRSY